MNYFYNYRNNTFFGFKTGHILLVVILIIAYYYWKVKSLFGSVSDGITSAFSDSPEQQKQNAERIQADAKIVENVKVSYGEPQTADISIANQLFDALSSFWGSDAEVIRLFGTISGKYQMNRVFSAFGVKEIGYGLLGFDKQKGNLISHLNWSKIDRNNVHKRKDGSNYTIQLMLNHLNS